MSDFEDNPPLAPPPSVPKSELETIKPPPDIDFSRMNDSEKLHWACQTLLHVANEVTEMHHKVNVLQGTVGSPRDPISPKLWTIVEQTGDAVMALSVDLESFRESLLGKGASVHELRRAATIRASTPPDDPDL